MPSQKSLVATPPSGVLRLPIALRLGWRLWQRFLLLQPIGHKSGQARNTVVEVIRYDRASDTFFIASGWGEHAHWHQSLFETPKITIQVGHRHLNVCAAMLPPREGATLAQASSEELERIVEEAPPIGVLRPQAGDATP